VLSCLNPWKAFVLLRTRGWDFGTHR
jgi:hypothetical protein